ncbi:MAG: heparan-alpha-glucosaminide N-acetyltransferase domain-containing protein [Lentisphaeria bacterium]|nr:heparan-alpha-glucosaminide N-acetyltransferase domain-containing protein [Lentisphaeria bacterium]
MQERMPYFDHVRGILVALMIMCHTVIVYGTDRVLESPLGVFLAKIMGTWPGAPVFMILMGIFFVYPKAKPAQVRIARGVKLFLLGLVLNCLRLVFPYLMAKLVNPDAFLNIHYLTPNSDFPVLWQLFYLMDILTFAGLAFILLALFELVFKKDWHLVVLGLLVALIAPALWGTGRDWGVFYPLVQPFWGNALIPGLESDTSFPVFPWLVYPIVGILIGRAIVRGDAYGTVLKKMLFAALVLGAAGGLFVFLSKTNQFGDFYRMYPGGTFLCVAIGLLWIGQFMLFTKLGVFQKILDYLIFWSKNITLIYLVQWVLIGFGIVFLGYRQQNNPWLVAALIPVFCVLSYFATKTLLGSSRFMSVLTWFTR